MLPPRKQIQCSDDESSITMDAQMLPWTSRRSNNLKFGQFSFIGLSLLNLLNRISQQFEVSCAFPLMIAFDALFQSPNDKPTVALDSLLCRTLLTSWSVQTLVIHSPSPLTILRPISRNWSCMVTNPSSMLTLNKHLSCRFFKSMKSEVFPPQIRSKER
ncbi:hypothetical protein M758_2G149500 [Ceratodon purpureus]|nr:hypothetical protein M758_2G149500 [Ceratodon purpureus]